MLTQTSKLLYRTPIKHESKGYGTRDYLHQNYGTAYKFRGISII